MGVGQVFSFSEDWHKQERARPLVRQYQIALDAVLEARPELTDCAVECKHCGIRFFTHPRNAGREDLRCPFGCRKHHRRKLGRERSRRCSQKAEAKEKKQAHNKRRSFPVGFDDVNSLPDVNSSSGVDLSPGVNASPDVDSSRDADDPPHVHVACELSSDYCCGATTEGRPEVRREDAIPAAALPAVALAEGREGRIVGGDTEPEGARSYASPVSRELSGAKSCLTDSHREATNIENPEEALLNLEISLGGVVLDGASVVNSPILPYVRMAVGVIARKSISKDALFGGLLKIMRQRSIDPQANTRYVSRFLDRHPP